MALKLPSTIEQNIRHFTGRIWLLPHLLEWLEHTEERLFILTGEPGTGKSMIVAWLAGVGPVPEDAEAQTQLEQIRSLVKAVHFCVASSGSVSPVNFAENVANQLAHNAPGFGDALATTLEDRVQISTVQHIEKIEDGSSVTGVYIERLDLGGLSEELSFDRVLREPLRKLYADGYNEPILLLVDALDEATTYTGAIDLVRLLTKLSDLPQPVHLLVTTRPDPRILKFYKKLKPFNFLKDAPKDMDDVRFYAYERLAELEHGQRNTLANRIAQAAQGIFLYAHLVVNELLARLPEIPDLETISLPEGLKGLYHDFLNRELGTDEDRWYAMFKLLLGLIAVAQGEGLTRAQIEHILNKEIEQPLRICKQYLTGDLPDGPFRPFHQSFADFLLRDEENVDYHIDAVQMHGKIAEYYVRTYSNRWKNCDFYGLSYLPYHQIQGQMGMELETILSNTSFIEAKCAIGMGHNLIADIQAALTFRLEDLQVRRHDKIRWNTSLISVLSNLSTYARIVAQPMVLSCLLIIAEHRKDFTLVENALYLLRFLYPFRVFRLLCQNLAVISSNKITSRWLEKFMQTTGCPIENANDISRLRYEQQFPYNSIDNNTDNPFNWAIYRFKINYDPPPEWNTLALLMDSVKATKSNEVCKKFVLFCLDNANTLNSSLSLYAEYLIAEKFLADRTNNDTERFSWDERSRQIINAAMSFSEWVLNYGLPTLCLFGKTVMIDCYEDNLRRLYSTGRHTIRVKHVARGLLQLLWIFAAKTDKVGVKQVETFLIEYSRLLGDWYDTLDRALPVIGKRGAIPYKYELSEQMLWQEPYFAMQCNNLSTALYDEQHPIHNSETIEKLLAGILSQEKLPRRSDRFLMHLAVPAALEGSELLSRVVNEISNVESFLPAVRSALALVSLKNPEYLIKHFKALLPISARFGIVTTTIVIAYSVALFTEIEEFNMASKLRDLACNMSSSDLGRHLLS